MSRTVGVLALVLTGCAGAAADVEPAPFTSEPICYARTVERDPCSGAERSPEQLAARPRERVEICDYCRADADCDARAGGRCRMLLGDPCDAPHRVCVYPDEPCFDDDGCGGAERCLHDGPRAICRQRGPMPP